MEIKRKREKKRETKRERKKLNDWYFKHFKEIFPNLPFYSYNSENSFYYKNFSEI